MRIAIIAGLLGTAVCLTGCVSTITPPVAVLSSTEQAERCAHSKDLPGAPQIMTYDPRTGTETHTSTSSKNDKYSFSTQNRRKGTGVGVRGDADPGSGDFSVCREDGRGDEVVPYVAGAIIGAAAIGAATQ